jgi:hypothetical protein
MSVCLDRIIINTFSKQLYTPIRKNGITNTYIKQVFASCVYYIILTYSFVYCNVDIVPVAIYWNVGNRSSFYKIYVIKGIDNATEAIDKILRTAADFGLKKKRPKDKFRQQNKNWFDFELKVKKKEVYNKARLMSMIPNDPQVRQVYLPILSPKVRPFYNT